MDLLPILSTLRRHKTAAALIVLEVALTCAIVCNALHLISQRLDTLSTPSGLPEKELLMIDIGRVSGEQGVDDTTRRDLQALRALPGVKAVSTINQVPFGNNNNYWGAGLTPVDDGRRAQASLYLGSEGLFETLGLKVIEGRNFEPQELIWGGVFDSNPDTKLSGLIINKALAEKLYPGQPAAGKPIYVFNNSPLTIIGVVEQLNPPSPSRHKAADRAALLLPVRPAFNSGAYLLRVAPEQRDAVMKAALAALDQVEPGRVVNRKERLEDMRDAYYRQDRAMVGLLAGVCVLLLLVTAFGIVGLASFWVQQRTRMIGTRRALGATRGQILRYFQLENLLLTGAGLVLGMAGAWGLNLVLMQQWELPRLPWVYLPFGTLLLVALGQIGVLAPARRAAALPPVAALRS